MTRSRRPVYSAALILASACLSDRPVAPRGTDGALTVRVAVPDVVKQSVSVLVTYSPYDGDAVPPADSVSPYQLFQQSYSTAPGFTRVTANFSLARCLSQYPPDEFGPYCDVAVQLQLLSDSAVVDARTLYPVRVRPGVVTTTDTVTLGAANAAPMLTGTPARGVLVAPSTRRRH